MWTQQALTMKSTTSKKIRLLEVLLVGPVVLSTVGCASRTLAITQGDRINNAMHIGRHPDQRTGDPLEVTIVCVHPDDLEIKGNGGLKPGSGITCKDWYDNRPEHGGEGGFDLPADQIYLLTNEDQVYGKKVGSALNGAINDGHSEVKIKGITFRGMKLHRKDSVIYVFPKFIGPDGHVLPVPAAEFSPPGAYASQLAVKIGVDEGRAHNGQYIENTSQRKLHGSGKRR